MVIALSATVERALELVASEHKTGIVVEHPSEPCTHMDVLASDTQNIP